MSTEILIIDDNSDIRNIINDLIAQTVIATPRLQQIIIKL